MHKECPICGRPLSMLDIILSEHDARFQCHHCWNRVNATGPVTPPALSQSMPQFSTRRTQRGSLSRRKK
jgi:transposase-like protein